MSKNVEISQQCWVKYLEVFNIKVLLNVSCDPHVVILQADKPNTDGKNLFHSQ